MRAPETSRNIKQIEDCPKNCPMNKARNNCNDKWILKTLTINLKRFFT